MVNPYLPAFSMPAERFSDDRSEDGQDDEGYTVPPPNVFPGTQGNEDRTDLSELQAEPGIMDPVTEWLTIPLQFIKPKTMCAVNQFVHIVSELDDPYVSSTCELVLVGTGSSIPEHFRMMIYCMEMVIWNSGCIVSRS